MADTERQLTTQQNMIWNSVGNFIYLFSQWLLTYVVVRVLGYESAGIFSLAMTISTSFYCIALYSMRNYQTSDVNDEYSTDTYVKSRSVTSVCSAIACICFVFVNGYEWYTGLCIVVFMLFKVSEAYADVYYGVVQKRMRMDYIGISFTVKGVVEFLVFLTVLVLVKDLFIALVAITAVSFIVVVVYDRVKALDGFQSEPATWATVKSLLVACLPVAIYGFLFNTAAQAPRYFLDLALGAEQLGYYTSVAMPVVIVQVCANFVFAPLITPMALHLKNGDVLAFRGMLLKTLGAIAAIAVVALVGFALLGEWLLVLLFGPSIEMYTYLIVPLVVCTILTALAWFLSAVATVLRKMVELLVLSAVMLVLIVAGSLPFISVFGLNGASYILMIGLAVFSIGCAGVVAKAYRTIKSKPRESA